MKRPIVCKFGGSSVADAAQIQKVATIISDNRHRRYVIVSAPGRDPESGKKITDHLINIATHGEHFAKEAIDPAQSVRAITAKFTAIVETLNLDADDLLEALADALTCDLPSEEQRIAWLASRGEHFNARIIARYLQSLDLKAEAKLPEAFGLTVTRDYLDAKVLPESYEAIASLGDCEGICVIPGFYGVTTAGEIALFSRGGSDLTGGEIAYALNASLYENWTDTDGVYEVDPRLIDDADVIPRLTFKEIRLLSSKGFNVFHFDAMMSCKKRRIPINIRNTNKPSAPGTMILFERVPEEHVVGIAKLDNMAYIYLEKDMLGEELGFTQKLLAILAKHRINTFHYPTDKDDVAVLVNQEELAGSINDLRHEIETTLNPDFMDVVYNLAVISPVGLGLKDGAYAMADAITALRENNIAIELMDQSPAHLSFHIGIQQAYADDALRILHRKLIKEAS